MADRKVLFRSNGSMTEVSPTADKVRAVGVKSDAATASLETIGGRSATLSDAANALELSGTVDLSFNGTKLGSVAGSTKVGDAGGYTNFTPTGATVRGALQGIDAALASVMQVGVNFTAGELIQAGRAVRILANNTVVKAIATSLAAARVVGVAESAIASASTGFVTTGYGSLVEAAQFVTGLTLAANDEVFLSAVEAGKFTNVKPSGAGQIVKPIGVVKDAASYVGTMESNSLASIIFQPGLATMVV